MHSPAARALLQPRALLHHPRDTLKDLTLAGHVITITYKSALFLEPIFYLPKYSLSEVCFNTDRNLMASGIASHLDKSSWPS